MLFCITHACLWWNVNRKEILRTNTKWKENVVANMIYNKQNWRKANKNNSIRFWLIRNTIPSNSQWSNKELWNGYLHCQYQQVFTCSRWVYMPATFKWPIRLVLRYINSNKTSLCYNTSTDYIIVLSYQMIWRLQKLIPC